MNLVMSVTSSSTSYLYIIMVCIIGFIILSCFNIIMSDYHSSPIPYFKEGMDGELHLYFKGGSYFFSGIRSALSTFLFIVSFTLITYGICSFLKTASIDYFYSLKYAKITMSENIHKDFVFLDKYDNLSNIKPIISEKNLINQLNKTQNTLNLLEDLEDKLLTY